METRIPESLRTPTTGGIRLDGPNSSDHSTAWIDVVDDALEGADDGVHALLAQLREYLGMDVAIVSEFVQDKQVFRLIEGDGGSFGLHVDDVLRLDESLCREVLKGRLPSFIPDTSTESRASALPAARASGIGAYIGVPLTFSDGTIYGTLCCLNHSANPALGEVDVKVAELIARLIADQLERRELEATNVRLQMENVAVRALLAALEARDGYTGAHSEAVVALAQRIGERMGMSPKEILEVRQVATLHDIGKIGIPDNVLLKSGPLTPAERILMREHPLIGWRIVSAIPRLKHLAEAVRAEHERWDGNGYPDRLAGEDIPVASRIVLVADAYHAMVSDRPYRAAIGWAAAVEELRENAGSQFCPRTVEALIEVLEHAA
ncbi:MAG: HD-GYP domain-containing protein [Actinomycetota bacterium]